ncbi:hypothetical protein JYT90_00745 [bacterium AH-315-P07]|nr:hypothetical protein [bacterium AH-315-P07]
MIDDENENLNGVPLGGIGTGSIEMGRDGMARNITINNNRTSATRLSHSPNAFSAIRVSTPQETYTRILQSETNIPFESAGLSPTYTPSKNLGWHGLYPTANYKLRGKLLPIPFQWTAMAPLIPYDNEASNLPMNLHIFKFKNTTEQPITVSALVNWENIRGCFADTTTNYRGLIHPVFMTDLDEYLHPHNQMSNVAMSIPIGLSFAIEDDNMTSYEGNYCLTAANPEGVRVTHLAWDHQSEDDVRKLWNTFSEQGQLPNQENHSDTAYQGSVCASKTLEPGDFIGLTFCFSWYCPVYTMANEDVGNYYSRTFASAVEVNEEGLKNAKYFQDAVTNFHERFLKSSLPEWYSRMLINNSHVLSTNTILTRENEYAMMESPANPYMGVLDRSFYSSIGTMLFFPSFADTELRLLSSTDETKTPGRIFRDLGKETVRHPGYGGGAVEMIELNAKFILLSYRNFHMTGKYASLMMIHPRLKEAIEYGMRMDRDGDGIPDAMGDSSTFKGWAMYGLTAYSSGIWIAALVAYADLTRELKNEEEARFYEEIAKKALHHVEHRLWVKDKNYYRLFHNAKPLRENHPRSSEACHSAQLVGAWVADFLKLGGWFPKVRTHAALHTIEILNKKKFGYTKGSMPDGSPVKNPADFGEESHAERSWPAFEAVYLACTHIYQGNVDKGMQILNDIYRNVHLRTDRQFNQPLSWNPETNEPTGWKNDHHMGSLSVWHSLYALLGFFLSIPRKAIAIAPNLPTGLTGLDVPLVTPVSFGRLKYECIQKPYKQSVLINFESPLAIKIIQLSIPKELTHPVVSLKLDQENTPFKIQVKPNQNRNELNIHLEKEMQIQQPIQIRVTER